MPRSAAISKQSSQRSYRNDEKQTKKTDLAIKVAQLNAELVKSIDVNYSSEVLVKLQC